MEFKDSDYPSQIKYQYKKFKELLGFNPSHIDIHKAPKFTNSFSVVADFCKKNNIPFKTLRDGEVIIIE